MIMVGLGGCDTGTGEAINPDNGDEELAYGAFALEAEDGGFDEDSAEGVEEFFMEPEADEFDEMEEFPADDEAETDALAGPEGPNAVRLLLAWGQFPIDWDLQEVTTWDGFIFGLGAKVFVRRALRYEKHDYYAPCQGHQCVMVYSHTVPHHDGLLLTVVPEPGATNPRVVISFAGQFKRVIPVSEIPAISQVTTVDDLNNKVVLMGTKIQTPCQVGLTLGYWKRMNLKGGIFGGRWIAADGAPMGKLAGLWGMRNDGSRVLFGLYLSENGAFKGVIKGTYQPDPAATGGDGGVFDAKWRDKGKDVRGVLRGRYTIAPTGGKGSFHGRWAARCGAETPVILTDGTAEELPADDTSDCACGDDASDADGFVDCACE